jgi:hypothetical protein
MTAEIIFLTALAVLSSFGILFAGPRLASAQLQFMAAVPVRKISSHTWSGLNLSYYGFFTATSATFMFLMFFLMIFYVNGRFLQALLFMGPLLALSYPASVILASLIDQKKFALSVGAANFVCFLLAPFLLWALDATLGRQEGYSFPVLPYLAALSITYCFGEGVGGLACVSFGCCYGKPVPGLRGIGKKLFTVLYLQYTGETKKALFAGKLDGQKVVPIQLITSLVYVTCGLAGLLLFFTRYFRTAFVVCIAVVQIWRIFSETVRADYRGSARFTAYQKMAAGMVVYSLLLAAASYFFHDRIPLFHTEKVSCRELLPSLKMLWSVSVIVTLEIVWLVIFRGIGWSNITGSEIRFTLKS